MPLLMDVRGCDVASQRATGVQVGASEDSSLSAGASERVPWPEPCTHTHAPPPSLRFCYLLLASPLSALSRSGALLVVALAATAVTVMYHFTEEHGVARPRDVAQRGLRGAAGLGTCAPTYVMW